MAMPNDLVLVRHGQSEANVVQKLFKSDPKAKPPAGFEDRHDSNMILSPEGVEHAKAAGEWLRANFKNGFDKYYTSEHARAVQTAGLLKINGQWRKDDRWRERDWGEFASVNEEEREGKFKDSFRLKKLNKWYWGPPGGESLGTGTRLRFEDILDTLHREADGLKVIAVTHGETIDVARFVLERMSVEEWLANDKDPDRKIMNCQIIHYTRVNPKTGVVEPRLQWFRSICPWDDSKSWEGGEWIEIKPRRYYSDQDLLDSLDHLTPLLN